MTEQAAHPPVLYEVDGGVARITINRPDRRNAINQAVVRGISSGLTRAESEGVAAVVLTGAGERAFCAGGDLGDVSHAGPIEQHFGRAEIGELFLGMRRSSVPIVARVNGHALAGGFGLMLACDLVIAADHVEVGTPEIDLGLWPFMISAILRRDIPRKIALELMLTGTRIPVEQAARWGFVNRVVPRDGLDQEVAELTAALGSKSRLIMGLGKRSFYRAEDMRVEEALEYLAGMLTLCLGSDDALEGVTAFLEKRPPSWKGR